MRIIKLLLSVLLILNSLGFVTCAATSDVAASATASSTGSQTKTDTSVTLSTENLLSIMDEVEKTIIKFNAASDPMSSPLLGSPSTVFYKTTDKNGNIVTDYHYANGTIASIDNFIGGVKYTTFYRTAGSLRDGMTITAYGSQVEGFDANQTYNSILQGKYDFKKNPSNVILVHLTSAEVNKMDKTVLKTILANQNATEKELTDVIDIKKRFDLGWIVVGYLKNSADGISYGCALAYFNRYPESRIYASNTKTFSMPASVSSGSSNASGYIKGSIVGRNDGHSTLTVDNSKNNSSVLGKLYCISGGKYSLARTFRVKKGDSFEMKNLSSGTYEIRYELVSVKKYYKSDKIKIAETAGKYTKCTLTLYTVTHGNTHVYNIKAAEF